MNDCCCDDGEASIVAIDYGYPFAGDFISRDALAHAASLMWCELSMPFGGVCCVVSSMTDGANYNMRGATRGK